MDMKRDKIILEKNISQHNDMVLANDDILIHTDTIKEFSESFNR